MGPCPPSNAPPAYTPQPVAQPPTRQSGPSGTITQTATQKQPKDRTAIYILCAILAGVVLVAGGLGIAYCMRSKSTRGRNRDSRVFLKVYRFLMHRMTLDERVLSCCGEMCMIRLQK